MTWYKVRYYCRVSSCNEISVEKTTRNEDYGKLYYRQGVGYTEFEAIINVDSDDKALEIATNLLQALEQRDLEAVLTLVGEYIDSESPIIDIHLSEVNTVVKVNTQ